MTLQDIENEKKYYIRVIEMCSFEVFREPKAGMPIKYFRQRSYNKSALKEILKKLKRSKNSPIVTLEKIACETYQMSFDDDVYSSLFNVTMWMIDIINAIRSKEENEEKYQYKITDEMYRKSMEAAWP